jgi:hypothetical protein
MAVLCRCWKSVVGFARTLGPAVLVVLGAQFLLLVTLMLRGRCQPLTRRIDIGLNIVTCTLLTWLLFAARIFQSRPIRSAPGNPRHRRDRNDRLGTQGA